MYSPTVRPRCMESRPFIRYQDRFFSIRDRPNRSRSQVSTVLVPGSVDPGEGLGERLPLQQLGVGLGCFDEFVLVPVEHGSGLSLGELAGALEGGADLRDHGLDAVGQQGALALLVPQGDGGLLGRPVSATNWATPRRPVRWTAAPAAWSTT